VTEGVLHELLQRCCAEHADAWEQFAAWVKVRGRMVLGVFERLKWVDREDIIADALKNLMAAVRDSKIRGRSNAEIDGYVCRSLRNQALNFLRGHGRRRHAGESTVEDLDGDIEPRDTVADDRASQEAMAIVAEQLVRADKLLQSWSPEDRYLFLAKLSGVQAQDIRHTLRRPPFKRYTALATIDTRYYRLREQMMRHIIQSHES